MENKVFNVGGGKPYSVNHFAQIVKNEIQKRKMNKLPEPEVQGLYRYGDTRHACSDISKLRALGWEPKLSPNESVQEYVDWLYSQDNVEDILKYSMDTMKEMNVVRETIR